MNIVLIDAQGILSERQAIYAKNRMLYSLARFGHRINGVTMHCAVDDKCEQVRCAVNANVEGIGVVSVRKTGVCSQEVLNSAVDAIEPKIACRVDWRLWFNAETFSTWIVSASQPLKRFFGLSRPETRGSIHRALVPNRAVRPGLEKRKILPGSRLASGAR